MTGTVGKNTLAGEELRQFIERIEAIDSRMKVAREDKGAVFAEAKARGFDPKAIRYCLKIRAEKPNDRAERESMQDIYLHAIGMDTEPPLFRFASLIHADVTARDQVVDAMRNFVPAKGSITISVEGTSLRLERDRDGNVQMTEIDEATAALAAAAAAPSMPSRPPREVPDVDEAGAEELGREAAKANSPIVSNPFPFGDPRRPAFDLGWRKHNGGDGMGPGD